MNLGLNNTQKIYLGEQEVSKIVLQSFEVFSSAPVDPFINNVSLLLHMDGTNGSQTFTDSSPNNFTLTAAGNAQISTAEKKFGTGSAYFDGNGDYIRGTQAFNYSSDFTIEGWLYRTGVGNGAINTIFEAGNIQSGQGGVGGMNFYVETGGTLVFNNGLTAAIRGGTAPLNQWVHFALVRNNSVNALYVNGVLIGTSTQTFPVTQNIFSLGGAPNYGFYFNGYIDEFRFTQGIARYTSNFIPPTAPFPSL